MNNQQHGEYQVKADNGGFSQKQSVGSHLAEMKNDLAEHEYETLSVDDESRIPRVLLQQRLDAYEQLHIEEMTQLREKIERLRRAFLQETNPQMHILSPGHDLHGDIEE